MTSPVSEFVVAAELPDVTRDEVSPLVVKESDCRREETDMTAEVSKQTSKQDNVQ